MSAPHAVVFHTDGVLLDSARLHAEAWKTAFDNCPDAWASSRKGRQPPFDADCEYRQWADGKPRPDGANSFLNSRGVDLPTGSPDSAPGDDTVWAVAARKETAFVRTLRAGAAEAFTDVAPALAVSASRHARPLLGGPPRRHPGGRRGPHGPGAAVCGRVAAFSSRRVRAPSPCR